MKIIDISWPISNDMTQYKDAKHVRTTLTKTMERDAVRESLITMSTHTGTHIDAPSHFLATGKSVDHIDLDSITGPCRILDFTHSVERITAQDLVAQTIGSGEIILLKTRNSFSLPTAAFDHNFVYLAEDAARYLIECRVKAVGIDYLGIERNQAKHHTHTLLMEHNITIIEGLRLGSVVAGIYVLCCLPLLLPGLDAAPARAVLIESI